MYMDYIMIQTPVTTFGKKKATFMLKGSLGYKLVWSHDQIL